MEKKTLYTLSVNDKKPGEDFHPDITAITFPLMRMYADKIGANFHVIRDRKHPDMPPVYEKFQIFDLGREHGNDWNIFFDADTLIHPDTPDYTLLVGKDMTVSHGSDFMPIRWVPDKYFRRDGRWIGKGNWCAIASDWCLDYWHPLDDMTLEEAVKLIRPTVVESKTVIIPEHLVDDWLVSRNIARFGLHHVLIPQIHQQVQAMFFDSNMQPTNPFWHQYTIRPEQKAIMMRQELAKWGVDVVKVQERWGVRS